MARSRHEEVVAAMERAIREQCGIPEFGDRNGRYEFIGITIEELPPDPRYPALPRNRLLIDGRRPEPGEIERRLWERIDGPLIEARQHYVINALYDEPWPKERIWALISATCMRCNSEERLHAMFPILN